MLCFPGESFVENEFWERREKEVKRKMKVESEERGRTRERKRKKKKVKREEQRKVCKVAKKKYSFGLLFFCLFVLNH